MYRNLTMQVFKHLQRQSKLFNYSHIKICDRFNVYHRRISCGACLNTPRYQPPHPPKANAQTSPALASKYQVINEENSPVIENTADEVLSDDKYPIISDEFEGINLKRGQKGVFEIEDLVQLLQRENSKDIFVATVPQDINYVEYICVVSARSKRHILALAEFVRKVYKRKSHKNDLIPRIEGKDSEEWMALDLGNIALHIFSEKTRKIYDLETLWSVGPEYDEQINKTNDVIDMLENYSSYLKDLKPLA